MQSHLADIDELVLRCRDDEARQYIAEAVASYKTGAFRACIVMTWIAVLYDFLYKLRELELAGDNQATAKLEEFENARKSGSPNQKLTFERGVLKWAHEDFEFINEVEYEELQRLSDDRNRCAHPTMTSPDEIYAPSSELARYHLRNAVNYMLQYPPTQGKTLVETLVKDVQRLSFPTDVDKAVQYFSSKQVDRAKESALRNFATVMIKDMVGKAVDNMQFEQMATALTALRTMEREVVDRALEAHLSNAIARLDDEDLIIAIRFLDYVPDTAQYLREDISIRLENYIKTIEAHIKTVEPDRAYALNVALDIPALRDAALQILERDDIDARMLTELLDYNLRPEFVPRALALYQEAWSFDSANYIGTKILIPLISVGYINKDNVEQILAICDENGQVRRSHEFRSVLRVIHARGIVSDTELDVMLDRYELVKEKYRSVIFPEPDDEPPT